MRSCYDKLGLEQRVAAKAPGIKGWVFRKLINFLVAQGKKGLDLFSLTVIGHVWTAA
jgi:hypothetical protein